MIDDRDLDEPDDDREEQELEPMPKALEFLLPVAGRFYISGADTGQYWTMIGRLDEGQLGELRLAHAQLAHLVAQPENERAFLGWWRNRIHAVAASPERRDDIAYQIERLSDIFHELGRRGIEPFASEVLTCFGTPGTRAAYEGPPGKCQATGTRPIECAMPRDGNPPILLCHEAADRLEHRALRPIEWFRLTARHARSEYWLWSDFYDDEGRPFQNSMYVDPGHDMPTFAEACADVDVLLDYAATRDGEREEIDEAIIRFGRNTVADAMVRRTGLPADEALRRLKVSVVLRLLGEPDATRWLDWRWREVRNDTEIWMLAQASVSRIGAAETMTLIRRAVDHIGWPGGDDGPPVQYQLPAMLNYVLAALVPREMLLELVLACGSADGA